jgi:hypothetical protein
MPARYRLLLSINILVHLYMFEYIYFLFEIAAFVTAIFQISKLKNSIYIYFIPYLTYVLFFEIANMYNVFSVNHFNLWITNINMTIAFLFYGFFLCAIIKTPLFKKWIKRIIYLSVFCLAIDMAFVEGFWKLDSITILLQYGIIIFINCLYFYELMNFTETELVVIKLPGFWLNTGLLFYCLAEFLVFSAFAYMAYKGSSEYRILFDMVGNIASSILYICLTLTFICLRKTTNP